MLSISNLGIVNDVKALQLSSIYQIQSGLDSLDIIAITLFGDQNYWKYLAYYNDIENPFGLISQGYTSIKVFSKSDIDLLIN
ncbi:hypothetical protein [Ralstonia phage RP13]|nr:hypothetical protein [Ralstonia phage RP13]